MAEIQFPTLSAAGFPDEGGKLTPRANTQQFESPLTGAIQTQGLLGDRWQYSLIFNRMVGSDSALLQAFTASLRGQANRAHVPFFHKLRPRGTIAGTPIVTAGSITGTTLRISGCTAGTTLLEGDFIGVSQGGVNAQILMVLAASSASGGGVMSLSNIFPEIRVAPNSGSTVVTSGPRGRFILANRDTGWTPRTVAQEDFAFDFMEAFPT